MDIWFWVGCAVLLLLTPWVLGLLMAAGTTVIGLLIILWDYLRGNFKP